MIDITSRLGDLSNWSQGYITGSGSVDITGANRRALNSQYYASVAGCRNIQFIVSYNFPQGTSEGSGAICVCERDAKGSVVAYTEHTSAIGEIPAPIDIILNEKTIKIEVAGRYLGSDYNGAVALLYSPPMKIHSNVNNGYPYNILPEEVPTTKAMVQPYPDSWWRFEDGYNNGYPFNMLMPDIPYNPPPPAPTIDPVEFYDEYNAEYLSALRQKHRRYKVRLELLGYYENVVGEITRDLSRGSSGSITINNEQITRRSCNLSLINVDKKYLPSPDSPIWFNRKFKLWIGIVTGKHTYWWSYGVFYTTKATCDGNTVNIQGVDKGGALDGTIKTGMLDAENIIERGTTLTNVIKDTLMWNEFSSPYLNHNTGASSYPVDPIAPIVDSKFNSITTQAEITINANDYISTLFSSIADGYGADAYYNTNGHFVFQTMADSNRIDGYRFMAHQWDFKDTDEMYGNASVDFNLDGYNVVTVYTNESTLENVSYTATNNNPSSPLRIDSAGIRHMTDVEIPYVNVEQSEMEARCKAYADYLLMKEAMQGMSITFSCPIIPHLDVNRTIGITDRRYNLDNATFVINSITMPLSADSMTVNATQFDWLPDDTNIEGGAV